MLERLERAVFSVPKHVTQALEHALSAVESSSSEQALEKNIKAYHAIFQEQLRSRGIPSHMLSGVADYVCYGLQPGSFLESVLADEAFKIVVARADNRNLAALPIWALVAYNDLPVEGLGNYEAVDRWITMGGLKGKIKRELDKN